jgi:hypothetical protein
MTASTMEEWFWLVGTEVCAMDCCNDTTTASSLVVDASKQESHFKSIQIQNINMRRIIALRRSQEEYNTLPALVLRRNLVSTTLIVCTHMNDFLFLFACAVAVGFLFPTMDDNNILEEIEQARKELGVDLLQASLNHYQAVSRMQIMEGL